MAELQDLANVVINGDQNAAVALTNEFISAGKDVKDILNQGLIAGMDVVGEKFKNNEFYLPEVLVAARAMKSAMAIVRPLLAESDVQPVGRVAIGTVQGDLHDIGKNLVGMMLEGAGFEVNDLGVDCSPQAFVDAVKEKGAKIIGLSALLTTTIPSMRETIKAFQEAGMRDQVLIMVGGAPMTQKLADDMGADGYAPDAASAVDKAKELLRL